MNERMLLEDGLKQLSLSFSPQSVEKLLRFSDLLLEKNRVMNLTAVTDPTEVVTRHFLDCAVLAPYLPAGQTVLDVGTGAGFPGVPLAILCPDTVFTLLDAQRKRVDFLQETIAALGLSNCTAVRQSTSRRVRCCGVACGCRAACAVRADPADGQSGRRVLCHESRGLHG